MGIAGSNVFEGQTLEEEEVGPELDQVEEHDREADADDAGADREGGDEEEAPVGREVTEACQRRNSQRFWLNSDAFETNGGPPASR